ncbi:MAG: phasin family protein [Alphaproteobacteria bacterium]
MMAQGKVNFEKLTHDATEMGRENVEAMIKSTTIFAKGFEDMMRTAMSFAQNTAEKQSSYMKEVMGSKTLHEFTEKQNMIAQANFDDFMSNATKLTEMSVKTLNESIEPLNSQLTKGMQKATKMAA